ncbi:TetR/AcrR family transcriptional regulator [Pedobacter sp. R20-19]|uniref:TetR/AcrR family transcriptional regulator n=1 Tax=Pedobacter sp. R20-19 TaxID=1270196 RepID=UPI0004936D44|nr:TetR/AcrR family transcriptional regulator [Pedobacter sp. R20-19]
MKGNAPDESVRDSIIDAATSVFERYGLHRVSMHDISAASGMGRSSLYHYFRNKLEVFDAVVQKLIGQVFVNAKAEIVEASTLAVNISKYELKKLEGIKAMSRKYHLALIDLKQDPALLLTKMRIVIEDETKILNDLINHAIERKEILPLNVEDRIFLAETTVMIFRSFEQEILIFDRFPQMEAKLSWLVSIFYKGLQ